jgi:beta-glucanase (GH16 family)
MHLINRKASVRLKPAVADRREPNYQDQAITWYIDENLFHSVTGSRIGTPIEWAALAQSPLYTFFNVAVGGNWVGECEFSLTFSR